MHCPKCGRILELLPGLCFHSGKSWYGCEPCNIVIESNHCSVSGREMGTNPCLLTYVEYKRRISEKEGS